MQYLYIQTNKDWNSENKFKYGYTKNPNRRFNTDQHSYKSSYLALYECIETDNYIYDYKEYDKIISRLHNIDDNAINQEAIENCIDLYKFIEIKKYLIYEKGGGTEFIRSNEGIELLDDIFMNLFKVSAKVYGWIFAIIAAGLITSSQLNTLLLKKYNSKEIVKIVRII